MPILAAIRDKIAATADITSAIEVFDFGDLTRPAIFMDPVQHQFAKHPNITLEQRSESDASTRLTPGSDLLIFATVWGDKQATDKTLRAIGMLLWRKLFLAVIAPAGYGTTPLITSAPIHTTDGEGFPGYTVKIEVQVLATS